jgi:hypothetical protein
LQRLVCSGEKAATVGMNQNVDTNVFPWTEDPWGES